MKIKKLMPVALAVMILAACSNKDEKKNQEIDNKEQIEMQKEENERKNKTKPAEENKEYNEDQTLSPDVEEDDEELEGIINDLNENGKKMKNVRKEIEEDNNN